MRLVILILLVWACVWGCNKIQDSNEQTDTMRTQYVGKKIIVNNDTLMIMKFNSEFTGSDEFVLSNGSRLDIYQIDKFKILK